jgi:3-methyladenine DNA glycosylase/8-oxoguanine DNA glycosylase
MGEHASVEEAIAHVVRVDPAFGRVVAAQTGRPPQVDYFNALARAIVYQQLAGRAAAASGSGRAPTPVRYMPG